MSEINLPDVGTITRTGAAYARDLAERTLATFVVAFAGVGIAAGPADMFHASFWESAAAAGVAAAGSLLKGVIARAFGTSNSASLAKGV
ncbi:hypothetical protein AB0J38_25750 [Streptomyces sp. NPDC050095]|uniref:hypothetical protein n=1 Tax=unclassified Streptomyces TaxID=2593676 RepID=UPI00341452DF